MGFYSLRKKTFFFKKNIIPIGYLDFSLLQALFFLSNPKYPHLPLFIIGSGRADHGSERRSLHVAAQAPTASSQLKNNAKRSLDRSKQPSVSRVSSYCRRRTGLFIAAQAFPLDRPCSANLLTCQVEADRFWSWPFQLTPARAPSSWSVAVEPRLDYLPPWLSSLSSEQVDFSSKVGQTTSNCSTHFQA